MIRPWASRTLCFLTGALVCACLFWIYKKWRQVQQRMRERRLLMREEGQLQEHKEAGGPLGLPLHRYEYNDLKVATNGFDPKNVLGRGGCGTVYKGLLPSATSPALAIKRIYRPSTRGRAEFLAEASVIGRMRHRNLVPLLGWAAANKELLLVYEFMPNGSLDKLLFGPNPPAWPMRFNIIKGVSAALAYLHEELDQRIVHRDVKSSNVMLDIDLNPRLGDFGLARLYEHRNKSPQSTHVAGTLGYMPPECYITGKVTEKIDVFSFGVLALEVICGRRPIMVCKPTKEMALPDWVWGLHKKNMLVEAADPRLEQSGGFHLEELERVLRVGLLCTHPNAKKRPSMEEVKQILRLELPVPKLELDRPMIFCSDSPIPLQSIRTPMYNINQIIIEPTINEMI